MSGRDPGREAMAALAAGLASGAVDLDAGLAALTAAAAGTAGSQRRGSRCAECGLDGVGLEVFSELLRCRRLMRDVIALARSMPGLTHDQLRDRLAKLGEQAGAG